VADLQRRAPAANVRWLGWVAPAEFFERVDAVIMPSLWHEPFGRVVVEARAYGVPVIAAKRGGIPETIVPGETGVLFEPTGVAALLAALDDFLQHFPHEQPITPAPVKPSEYAALFARVLAA